MNKQLIKEAKRFQELAGISEIKINDPTKKSKQIAVIKEWIWWTCDEGHAKDDIKAYNKMIDEYFADKNEVTKDDFRKIWMVVTQKYGVGDIGADWEAFPETWKDVEAGTLMGTY